MYYKARNCDSQDVRTSNRETGDPRNATMYLTIDAKGYNLPHFPTGRSVLDEIGRHENAAKLNIMRAAYTESPKVQIPKSQKAWLAMIRANEALSASVEQCE